MCQNAQHQMTTRCSLTIWAACAWPDINSWWQCALLHSTSLQAGLCKKSPREVSWRMGVLLWSWQRPLCLMLCDGWSGGCCSCLKSRRTLQWLKTEGDSPGLTATRYTHIQHYSTDCNLLVFDRDAARPGLSCTWDLICQHHNVIFRQWQSKNKPAALPTFGFNGTVCRPSVAAYMTL